MPLTPQAVTATNLIVNVRRDERPCTVEHPDDLVVRKVALRVVQDDLQGRRESGQGLPLRCGTEDSYPSDGLRKIRLTVRADVPASMAI